MERTDISWIKHDIIFHDKRHPVEMCAVGVEHSCLVRPMIVMSYSTPSGTKLPAILLIK
jgi:hypothetical protein